jgi:hypothetical protein
VPTRSAGNWYWHAEFEVVVRVWLVAVLVSATVALGTAEPLGSVTAPTIEPVSICAKTDAVARQIKAASRAAVLTAVEQDTELGMTNTPCRILKDQVIDAVVKS